jgi:putative spermidine/putrescine transport system permease protein
MLRRRHALYLLLPALLLLAVVFAYPMLDIVVRSVMTADGLSLAHYRQVFTRPIYWRVFAITFEIALATTAVTLALGYPLAYVLSTARKPIARLLMGGVLVAFFTDVLVRTYAWMLILGSEGVMNQVLRAVGLYPLDLLFNRYGVLIGMSYALLPYMILTLYSVMRGIDHRLVESARNLGANDWRAFRHVFLPLSFPGVAAGALLVFVLALGYFITPRLLGGPRDQMIGMLIEQQVELDVNWGLASALAIILLVLTAAGFVLYDRLAGLRTLFESKA